MYVTSGVQLIEYLPCIKYFAFTDYLPSAVIPPAHNWNPFETHGLESRKRFAAPLQDASVFKKPHLDQSPVINPVLKTDPKPSEKNVVAESDQTVGVEITSQACEKESFTVRFSSNLFRKLHFFIQKKNNYNKDFVQEFHVVLTLLYCRLKTHCISR